MATIFGVVLQDLYMGDYGKKIFEWSYLRKKISSSNPQVWFQDITMNAHEWNSRDFQNHARVLFFQLPLIHTCGLELDIFFLGWDMIF